MTYSHKTNHSFKPKREFWRAFENFFRYFPYLEKQSEDNRFDKNSFNKLIKYYERDTLEAFELKSKLDIYGDYLKQVLSTNYLGMLIKFLSESISNPDTVPKFQKFFESMYRFLLEFRRFRSGYGVIKPIEYINYFNSVCRKYQVPFVMFELKGECYVVHTTDKFIEKIIQNIPLFLKHPDLNQANDYFIKAYNERDKSNYSECLNNVRKGMEEIRDFIYNQYSLSNKTGNLNNDLKKLFNIHSNIVFDYTKIPETDSNRINKIVNYLKDSILLCVKITNIGSHSSSVPDLIEENTTLFALGLIASIFPYLFYLLK